MQSEVGHACKVGNLLTRSWFELFALKAKNGICYGLWEPCAIMHSSTYNFNCIPENPTLIHHCSIILVTWQLIHTRFYSLKCSKRTRERELTESLILLYTLYINVVLWLRQTNQNLIFLDSTVDQIEKERNWRKRKEIHWKFEHQSSSGVMMLSSLHGPGVNLNPNYIRITHKHINTYIKSYEVHTSNSMYK